jgi:hypothetical protein
MSSFRFLHPETFQQQMIDPVHTGRSMADLLHFNAPRSEAGYLESRNRDIQPWKDRNMPLKMGREAPALSVR